MSHRDITYALPTSCIRIAGTITETTDRVLEQTTIIPEASATLHVHGVTRDQTLRVKGGVLRDTTLKLELTNDGRLTSADAESVGQLGKVVLGVVGAGATVAGALTGLGGVAAALTAAAGAGAGREVAPANRPKATLTDEQRVAAKYASEHEAIAGLRAVYAGLIDDTLKGIAQVAKEAADDTGERWEKISRLQRLERLLATLRAELAPLDEHFKIWRASTITTRVETHERCFSLDTLRDAKLRVENGALTHAPDAHASVRFAWEQLGIAVVIPEPAREAQVPLAEVRENAILTRVARRTSIAVYERSGERAVLREQTPQLVVDAASETAVMKLGRSPWAKRSMKLGFSELGVVTSVASGSSSSAAAAADALGGLPGAVGGGLESASKIRTELASLRSAELDADAARAKKELELKQTEIAQAGLAATEKDMVALARLEQQAAIAGQRKSIRDAAEPAQPTAAALELAAVKARLELVTLERELAVAERRLQAETELGALRLEVERLRARNSASGGGESTSGQ